MSRKAAKKGKTQLTKRTKMHCVFIVTNYSLLVNQEKDGIDEFLLEKEHIMKVHPRKSLTLCGVELKEKPRKPNYRSLTKDMPS